MTCIVWHVCVSVGLPLFRKHDSLVSKVMDIHGSVPSKCISIGFRMSRDLLEYRRRGG
jgi:hypothetical protein